jgi:hypothetical protein
MDFKPLLDAVDMVLIVAIIGVAQGLKSFLPETMWRYVPLVVIVLGVLAGFLKGDEANLRDFGAKALMYSGAAAIVYELARTTILGKGAKAPH